MTKRQNRPGYPEAACELTKASPIVTARCRRCGRPLWSSRSIQREAGLVCWHHINAVVTA